MKTVKENQSRADAAEALITEGAEAAGEAMSSASAAAVSAQEQAFATSAQLSQQPE